MRDRNSYKKEIENKLLALLRKKSLVEAGEGIFMALLMISLFVLIAALAEYILVLNVPERTVLFVLLVISSAGALVNYILLPLFKMPGIFFKPDYKITALEAGKNFPEIKDELSNALQLIEGRGAGYSEELVEAAFKRVYEKSRNINFSSMVGARAIFKYLPVSSAAALLVFLLVFFIPGLKASAHRILNYRTEFVEPPKYVFEVEPGNARLTRGEDFSLKVTAAGDIPPYIMLHTKSEEQAEFESKKIIADSTGAFTNRKLAVLSSFEYYVAYEDITSPGYEVEVVNPPVIKGFNLLVRPPAYSGLPTEELRDNGNLTALPGSRVTVNLNSTKELSKAELFFGADTIGLVTGGTSATGGFTVYKDDFYKMVVEDAENNKNENPVKYKVETLTDEIPAIEVLYPGENEKLGQENRIDIAARIMDDYGFSKLNLNYRISASRFGDVQENFTVVEIPIDKKALEDNIEYLWDLTKLYLAGDDVVSWYLEVFDNDNVNGPKSAKTPLMTLRVPSLEELFAEADRAQEKSAENLEETLKEAEKLKQEMEKLSADLKRDEKEITWDEKEKIENSIKKFEELQKKADEVKKDLSEMQKDMQENNLLSQETLEKYMELQQLMDELSSDEMKDAFKRMQDMLQKMNRNQVQQSFDNMKQNEEVFKKSLERTINLLKRLQVETKMDELVKRTEDMQQRLEEMQNETSDPQNAQVNSEKLQEKQKDISQDMERMKEEMEKLQKQMEELQDMPSEEMKKLAEEFGKQKNEELSEQARQNMQNNQMQQAMQKQSQMAQNMRQMQSSMQKMQQQMQQANQMEVFNKMMKAVDNLLTLSKEQEELKNSQSQSMMRSPDRESAQKQSKISQGLDRIMAQLSELGQKTFAVNPEMGKALGQAKNNMQSALESMQGGNGPLSGKHQSGAMKNLNEAAAMMQNSLQNMMQQGSGQGGGMMSLMQQLQQMSQQQMSLNKMTQQLNSQGQLTQQQQAQLQKLAQQQQMIQKSLEQLNRESKMSGESKKMAADFDRVLQEMKEVITGMETEKLDDDLIEKQERILSKMLDAQRSINERDFEKRRESNEGEVFARKSPPELLMQTEEGRKRLRDELLKSARESYSKDYEELIRKYFDELEKAEKN